MRIAVMGAGGLGGYIGARLAEAGEDVAFIARGEHLAAMRERGLQVESPYGDLRLPQVTATAAPADLGPVDLVLFTVKLWDTDTAAAAAAPLIGSGTAVITFQNGIGNAEQIARQLPEAQVVGGLAYIPALVKAPGVIRNPGGTRRIVVDGATGNAAITGFADASRRAAGLEVELTEEIDRHLWEKFIRMSAHSAATSLMRATIGPILSNPESRAFLRQMVEEGVAVAAATGNPVAPGFADDTMDFYGTFPAVQRSSMAENLDRGRRLELPWLSGRLHGLGVEHNIPTPAHSAAYRALILHADGTRTAAAIT